MVPKKTVQMEIRYRQIAQIHDVNGDTVQIHSTHIRYKWKYGTNGVSKANMCANPTQTVIQKQERKQKIKAIK